MGIRTAALRRRRKTPEPWVAALRVSVEEPPSAASNSEVQQQTTESASADEGEIVRGDLNVAELNKRFQLSLSTSDYPTVSAFIFANAKGNRPHEGERISVPGAVLEVEEMSGGGKFVGSVRVFKEAN